MKIKKSTKYKVELKTYYSNFKYRVRLFKPFYILASIQSYTIYDLVAKIRFFYYHIINTILIYTKTKVSSIMMFFD